MGVCHIFTRTTVHIANILAHLTIQPGFLNPHRICSLAFCHLLLGGTSKTYFQDSLRDTLEMAKDCL